VEAPCATDFEKSKWQNALLGNWTLGTGNWILIYPYPVEGLLEAYSDAKGTTL
jgi:hypothetical protein